MPVRKYKPTSPGPPLHVRLDVRRDHEVGAREEPRRAGDEEGRPQRQRPHHDAPPGGGHKRRYRDHRLQARRRTACRRRWPRSSTTRTGRRGSRCSTTPTARRPTSSPRRGCASARPSSPGPDADIKPGNALPLQNIPTGTLVHNVELKPGRGGQMARSAGSGVQLVAKDEPLRRAAPSLGELRRVPLTCRATVGQVGNVDHQNVTGGKAGRSRWRGSARRCAARR